MPESLLERFDVDDPIHGSVPCAALVPAHGAALPLCLFLYGGGGSRETLAAIQPLLDHWWSAGLLPPAVIATPDVGPFSFYLDDPARGFGWESFIVQRFIAALRARYTTSDACGLFGISMGGYGALKLAFAQPRLYRAVAAMVPMIEPAFEAADVPLRNRFHYPPEVPQQLLGAQREAALYRADHPAGRARQNAAALRESDLAILIDAASGDALHAHDGAEFLHRVLWALDVPHEYHLRRDSDHAGPDTTERMLTGFAWTCRRISPPAEPVLDDNDRAWQVHLAGRGPLPKQPPAATSPLFGAWIRLQLVEARRAAEREDPGFIRRYGLL